MSEQALSGLRVIEFCDQVGSYAGKLLADLGADVIKVEPPAGGEERHTAPYFHAVESPDTSLAFWVHNTSKRSVVLDLDTTEGQEQARRLILTADAVLEDYPVGYLAARGLGYAELSALKPSLVYTSITGFGQFGPHADYAYTDIVGQAMGGILTLSGDPADPPVEIYGNQADVSASLHAAQGTLLALLDADATGAGQHVDVSAQEAVSMSQETAMQYWDLQKRNRRRTGITSSLAVKLPALGIYRCRDGWVSTLILAPGGADFPVLVDWMREKGMAADLGQAPYAELCANLNMRFLTAMMTNPEQAAGLQDSLTHIEEVVTAFFATMPAREAYEEGQGRRLLVGLVSTPRDLAENTQLRARNWYREFEVEYLGTKTEFPGPPYNLSETPAVIKRPPRLGEHTEEILASLT